MRCTLASFVVVTLLMMQASSTGAKGIELNSREYKLMLEPAHFAGGAAQEAVDEFLRDEMVRAIKESFGGDAADELAREGVDLEKHRSVRFLDTQGCALNGNGFALRERVDLDDNDRPASKPEITLKFRSSDLFLAADMQLKAKAEGAESKFEEDIGPLSLTNAGERFVASPRSARSRFSRSTSQTVKQSDLPQTLEDIDKLYPTFSEDLQLVADEIDLQAALKSGPEYRELVYRSSRRDVTKDTKAKFALTIWYEGVDDQNRPALAEISFSYDTDHGVVPAEAAQRARRLLLVMQDLDWAKPDAPTKTALAACPDTPS